MQRGFEKMTIKLEQIIEAIEMSDDFFTSFWDTKIGETVYLADPLLNGETDEVLAAEIENEPYPGEIMCNQFLGGCLIFVGSHSNLNTCIL